MIDLVDVNMLNPEAKPEGYTVQVGPLGQMVVGAPSGGTASLAWFNVKDPIYGAVGDGIADDTDAINLAIAALNAAGRGVLYFPSGIYQCAGALDDIDVPCTVLGDGCADSHFRGASTSIRTDSTTNVLLTGGTSGHGTTWHGINIQNNATGGAPTSGAGLQVLGGDGAHYENLTIAGFWINVDIQDGQEWTMHGCFNYSAVKYGLKIRHVDLTDGGDMGITNCQFLAGDYDCDALIRYESGGGMRVTNCKFNTRSSHAAQCGIDAIFTGFTTVDLIIVSNSFENVEGPFIRGRLGAFGEFYQVVIGGNQFAYYWTTTEAAIDIVGWNNLNIVGNVGTAKFAGSSAAFAKLDTCDHVSIGLNTVDGFAGGSADLIACTHVETTGGLTAEEVLDLVAAALIPGDGIDISYDDGAGTITISTTGDLTKHTEVVMDGSSSSPPVPIWNVDGTDYVYAEVS